MLPEWRPTMPCRLGPSLFTPASGEWQTAHFLKTAAPAVGSPSAQALPVAKTAKAAAAIPIERFVIPGDSPFMACKHDCGSGAPHGLSLIHISEPTRLGMISYAVFCL